MSIRRSAVLPPVAGSERAHPLESDPRALGLERMVVATRLGPVVVHRSVVRTSSTATVMLHGAAGSWTTWTPLLRAADPERVTDLVIPDLPGWGESPGPAAGVEAMDAASLAAAVAVVVRACGYESWRVVGHSLGGFVALELAALEPRATTSVQLVSPTTLGARGDRLAGMERWLAYPALYTLMLGMRMLAITGRAGYAFVRALNRVGLLRPLTSPLFAPGGRIDASVVDALAAEVRPAAFVRALRCAERYDAIERWGRIRCPVVAVHGDRDVFIGHDDDARLRRVVPQFTVRVLPATGHFGHIERPGLVAAELGL